MSVFFIDLFKKLNSIELIVVSSHGLLFVLGIGVKNILGCCLVC